jgi:hypothetical protein
MAAFQLSKLRQVHRDLGDILETYDALKAAEATATDNEQPESGAPGSRPPAAKTNSGTAQDRAPSLDTRTGRKLEYVPQTAAVTALEAAIPALTRLRGKY